MVPVGHRKSSGAERLPPGSLDFGKSKDHWDV
jgi:hypothetical protein